jgi:hypothetical protein
VPRLVVVMAGGGRVRPCVCEVLMSAHRCSRCARQKSSSSCVAPTESVRTKISAFSICSTVGETLAPIGGRPRIRPVTLGRRAYRAFLVRCYREAVHEDAAAAVAGVPLGEDVRSNAPNWLESEATVVVLSPQIHA